MPRFVMVKSRLHSGDITATFLAVLADRLGYEHLRLPLVYSGAQRARMRRTRTDLKRLSRRAAKRTRRECLHKMRKWFKPPIPPRNEVAAYLTYTSKTTEIRLDRYPQETAGTP